MNRYFLGVDVGASKTHALVADGTGRALGWGEAGPGNHEVVGYDGLGRVLQAAVGGALAAAGIELHQLAGAGFGLGGYDWPSQREPSLQVIRSLGLNAPLEVVNDCLVGLLAGASAGWGVAVVAGTGCNCWGWDRSRHAGRVTGMGRWMGEGAGGSELIGQAVCSVAKAWSRRGPRTRLTRELVEWCGARDTEDLLEGLGLGRFEVHAAAAPLVFRAAGHGDRVAQRLVCWAGRELGSLAVGVIRQLGFETLAFEVVLVGSLYDGGPALIEAMRRTIHRVAPQAHLVRLTAPPAIGGVLLGMEQAGPVDPAQRVRLIESTARLHKPAFGSLAQRADPRSLPTDEKEEQ